MGQLVMNTTKHACRSVLLQAAVVQIAQAAMLAARVGRAAH